MVFDEVIPKSYEQINCFKLLAVLLALMMLLLGSILYIEPLMASLTFYNPCPTPSILGLKFFCCSYQPFLQSGSTVTIPNYVNFYGELSLSLLAVLLIQSWRKVYE